MVKTLRAWTSVDPPSLPTNRLDNMLCRPRRSYDAQALPPITMLPIELLAHIFILATHDSTAAPDGDEAQHTPLFSSDTIRTPLIISTVCRHWRIVSRNTPALWTSLCMTVEMIDFPVQDTFGTQPQRPDHLDTRHLTSYLALSRNYPLDILIDARDQDWDFSEPEIPSEDEFNTYTPPFSSAHMHSVISILLPHLSRWRSVNILTDSWAPMYIALQQINLSILTYGAPLLETLTLMRCNDFVSYSSEFQPADMREPKFLRHRHHHLAGTAHKNLLPRLHGLVLRGVHIDWSSLACILSIATSRGGPGLRNLELSSHCADVRPSLHEFHSILAASPGLRQLTVNGSGPIIPDDVDILIASEDGLTPALLPQLEDITIGYRSALEGQKILELLDAPNAKVLSLEDTTHPGDPDEVDAGGLLTYLGTGDPQELDVDYEIAYTISEGHHYEVALPRGASTGGACPAVETPSQAAFPLLESVTLKSVKSCPRPLQAFFSALPNLQRLELTGMSMHTIHALLPSGNPTAVSKPAAGTLRCPCPHLQSLCIRGLSHLQMHDFDFLVGGFAAERANKGACGLKEVDIHMEGTGSDVEDDVVKATGETGTQVKIFREPSFDDVEEDEDNDVMDLSHGWTGEVNPFKVGGVFNDPLFDAYYTGSTLLR